MERGTIISYIRTRGFGFIAPAVEAPDIFFHVSSLPPEHRFCRSLVNRAVTYELGERHGRPAAVNIKLVPTAAEILAGQEPGR